MTIASELTKLNTNMQNAYTAVSGKGGTLPQAQNMDNLATTISSIPSSGSSGTTGVELTRFKDDTNTEIGTHYMNFEDGSGNVFKVILLDAQYRNSSTQWCSNTRVITNMPHYSDLKISNIWEAKETATTNTQLILDYCSSGGYTSSACTHCRNKSFTIGGITYYGQLPNLIEVSYIARNYNSFDILDTSASSQSSLNFSTNRNIWSSSQYPNDNTWYLRRTCDIAIISKTSEYFACPILEIPA